MNNAIKEFIQKIGDGITTKALELTDIYIARSAEAIRQYEAANNVAVKAQNMTDPLFQAQVKALIRGDGIAEEIDPMAITIAQNQIDSAIKDYKDDSKW